MDKVYELRKEMSSLKCMFKNSISNLTKTDKFDWHTDSLINNIRETKTVFAEKRLTSTIGNTE